MVFCDCCVSVASAHICCHIDGQQRKHQGRAWHYNQGAHRGNQDAEKRGYAFKGSNGQEEEKINPFGSLEE